MIGRLHILEGRAMLSIVSLLFTQLTIPFVGLEDWITFLRKLIREI